MLVFLLADCETRYIFNGVPYTGKDPTVSAPYVGLAAKMVKVLTKDLWNSDRNIFNNFKLADDLRNNRTTCVGTVTKKQKRYTN